MSSVPEIILISNYANYSMNKQLCNIIDTLPGNSIHITHSLHVHNMPCIHVHVHVMADITSAI